MSIRYNTAPYSCVISKIAFETSELPPQHLGRRYTMLCMPKKPSIRPFRLRPAPQRMRPEPQTTRKDLFFHAHSFHIAAKRLSATLEFGTGPFAEFDVAPVIFLYRHALELHLKAIVLGEGGNLLATKPDPISISNSHSLPWLMNFVWKILVALGWEKEFRSEGVDGFAELKAVLANMNDADPGSHVFRWPVDPRSPAVVQEFIRSMDRLLDLLASTADAIAAELHCRSGGTEPESGLDGGGFGPTIQ